MGLYKTSYTALTSGQTGIFRITSTGAMYTEWHDAFDSGGTSMTDTGRIMRSRSTWWLAAGRTRPSRMGSTFTAEFHECHAGLGFLRSVSEFLHDREGVCGWDYAHPRDSGGAHDD